MRDAFPRDRIPNPNPPLPTVGPTSSDGFGNTHVMYPEDAPPIEAEAFAGWPVGWQVPSNLTGGGDLANKVSIVFACIDLNARILGSFPVYARHKNEVIDPGPAWLHNPAPGLYYGFSDAIEQMWWTYQMRGEIFLWALSRYADGTVRNFTVLNPDLIDVQRGTDGYLKYSLFSSDWDQPAVIPLDRADVLHIPYMKWPGDLRGTGPLSAAAGNLRAAYNAASHSETLAYRGGVPFAVLNTAQELSDDEVTALRKQWTDSAARRDGAPAVTSGGFTLTPLGISPDDMNLLETRGYDEARIAVLLGVEPFMVGISVGSGGSILYQNVTAVPRIHWAKTLRPATRKIAEAVSGWAMPRGTKLRFNPEEYIRGDIDERVDTLVKLHGIEDDTGRVLTAAMIRDAEDFTAKDETHDDGTTEGKVLHG